ncbi:hypothetical protein [Isoptericola aurantiacus]|uniref:hypothetical protein n=1 Tax=Isoptericola aurantiacus TaxID=3377839 RepID=UPI00383AAEA3
MTVMPYARWRRWVRALRTFRGRRRAAGSGDPSEQTYLAYGFVLLALMYGPILWSALSQVAGPLGLVGGSAGREDAVALGGVAVGAAGLAGVLGARWGVPLWVTAVDGTYALSGVWDPRTVLWRRVVVLIVAAGAAAALVGSALAAGGGPAGDLLGWALCAAGTAQLPLALAVAAQGPRWRAAARGVAVVTAVLAAAVAIAPGSLPAAAVGIVPVLAVVLAVVCGGLLLVVLPNHLDVDDAVASWQRTVQAGAALAGGDAAGVGARRGPASGSRRRGSFPAWLLQRAPLVARDLVGLGRRVGALTGSVLGGALGAALVAVAADGGPGTAAAAVGGGVVLYAASAVWAGGLRDMAEQRDPAGLLPGGPWRAALGHLGVPAALAVVVGALGLGVAAAVVPVDGATAVVVAAELLAVLGVRPWVAGATQAPPELFTPMSGPGGDMSMVVVGGWFVRGWLVVVGAAWTLARLGEPAVPLVVVLAVWLAVTGLRRLDRA